MRAPLHTTLQAAAKLAPWLLVFVVCGMSCSDETLGPDSNAAPGKPQTPQGPAVAVINARTNYSSSAVDPDNDPVALWFFWGDGDSTLAGPSPGGTTLSAGHSYSALGSFRIRVVAVDDGGLRSIASDELRISVLQTGPQAPSRPAGPDSLALNRLYSYTSSANTLAGGFLSLTFFWGDGDSTLTPLDTSGSMFAAEHVYYDTGMFLIRASASDDSGRVTGLSPALTVRAFNSAPLRPAPPFGPTSAAAEQTVTFLATAIDPEGHDMEMTFHWGDGASQATQLLPGQQIFSSEHKYNDTGMFLVRVSAKDVFGAESDTSAGTLIHIPVFPIDTVLLTVDGLSFKSITIDPGGRVEWINRDAVAHIITPDVSGAFPGVLIKPGESGIVTFETSGVFGYHDGSDPADTLFQGTIRVR